MSALDHGPERKQKRPPITMYLTDHEAHVILEGMRVLQDAMGRGLASLVEDESDAVVLTMIRGGKTDADA